MIEHLDQQGAVLFLTEARRVLTSGGIIRLAVPDIRMRALKYVETNDADAFVASTFMAVPRPRTFAERLAAILVGPRHHAWMYDGPSLSRLLELHGFVSPRILKAGETQITEPQNLDLYERAGESVYVEALNS